MNWSRRGGVVCVESTLGRALILLLARVDFTIVQETVCYLIESL